ncbi:MAG: helix-turn-helix transcriptional regulator [Oscillospiraceae bacterium]|nr:helix-turn-helix transcriptional regulator [Oscillospiraceae bacterium]
MRKVKSINQQIGANIRAVRDKSGYTQEELSERLGITPNHLSAIERGVSGATLEHIKKLCALCAVSADVLLFGESADATGDELTEHLKHVRPEYRLQVNKVLLAMLDALSMQESSENK